MLEIQHYILLSDLANGVTGEIHYVDAGYNKMPDPKNITKI